MEGEGGVQPFIGSYRYLSGRIAHRSVASYQRLVMPGALNCLSIHQPASDLFTLFQVRGAGFLCGLQLPFD